HGRPARHRHRRHGVRRRARPRQPAGRPDAPGLRQGPAPRGPRGGPGRRRHRDRRRRPRQAPGQARGASRRQPAPDQGHAPRRPPAGRGAGTAPHGAHGDGLSGAASGHARPPSGAGEAPRRAGGWNGAVTAHERAPGKVNLGLAVLTRRGDGFHELETLFARLELADELELALLRDRPGEVDMSVEADPYPGAPEWFAASVAALPADAGLGGGSSDAGAARRALVRLVPGEVDVPALALELGSDVPFFVSGASAALARGRGERLLPAAVPALPLVLAKPALTVSAAEAYAALVGFTGRLGHEAALAALARGEEPGWRNGLQAGVMRAHGEVRELLKDLRDLGLRGVLMSGSGPTCF